MYKGRNLPFPGILHFFKRFFTKLSGAAGSEIWFTSVFTAVCFDDSLSRDIVVVVVSLLLRVDSIGNLSTTDDVVVVLLWVNAMGNTRNGAGGPHLIYGLQHPQKATVNQSIGRLDR
jgi:hypothetical protein